MSNTEDLLREMNAEIDALKERVSDLENKKRRIKVRVNLSIDDYKKAFLERLKEPNAVLEDGELVFWASYVLGKLKRPDIIKSVQELAKRQKNIADLLKWINDHHSIILGLPLLDLQARTLAKEYLEYVFKYCTYSDGPLDFYRGTSAMTFNKNYSGFLTFRKLGDDKPL